MSESNCPNNDHERDSRSQSDNVIGLLPAAEGATRVRP